MTATSCDLLIAGGGIIGLAAAREAVRRKPGLRVVVLEKENGLGAHASGRNSGVLHSGIYYAPGSAKARLCAEGARRMADFARENHVPVRVCGKVILAASDADLAGLDRLMANARANGVRAERLDEGGVRRLEPSAAAERGGIHCPDTAVIDPGGLLEALAARLKEQRVDVRLGEGLARADPGGGSVLSTAGNTFSYGFFLNAAGAHADKIARLFGFGRGRLFIPFKGLYRKLPPERASLVNALIYPVPDPRFPFLGVHFTRSVHGEVYAGPTAIPALGRENYGIVAGLRPVEAVGTFFRLAALWGKDAGFRSLVRSEVGRYGADGFLEDARRLIPSIRREDLLPCGKVGIRPQLLDAATGRLETDYLLEGDGRSLHVLNAVSPAFTSAFSFAEWVVDRVPL